MMLGPCFVFKVCVVFTCFSFTVGLRQPQVSLNQGDVIGFYDKTGSGKMFASFVGIPYAKPPIGKYRFKEAKPAKSWTGVYNATQNPSSCLQYDHMQYKTEFAVHGEEDCLYVNVYSPQIPTGEKYQDLLDVIVYIHGGAFMSLHGHAFQPHQIIENNIVYITFNYRVGPLGFLSTEDDVIPGNFGLKDQSLALKWIKDNVRAFGGNPDKITVAGMSAGGVSVHYHMLSTKSKGLFKYAIAMSGTSLVPWAQTENSRGKAFLIGQKLGCPLDDSSALLECLRGKPARQIVELSKMFMPWLYVPFSPFGPVVEKVGSSAFIDRAPVEIVRDGVPNDVPLILSFTSHEGLYPGSEIICNDKNLKTLYDDWFRLAPHVLDYNFTVPSGRMNEVSEKIKDKYLKTKDVAGIIQMIGDRLYVADIVKTAKLQAASMESPIYLYNFTYRGENSLTKVFCNPTDNYGVSHGDDLGYVLPTFLVKGGDTDADNLMKANMMRMWIDFTATGKPTFGETEYWPTVESLLPQLAYLDIDSPRVGTLKKTDAKYLEFWSSLKFNENVLESTSSEHRPSLSDHYHSEVETNKLAEKLKEDL